MLIFPLFVTCLYICYIHLLQYITCLGTKENHLCAFIPELYKEYRSLKQAKENNSSTDAASGRAEQSKSTAEVNPAQKVLKKVSL